jgi:hypothetical protein
VSFWQLQFARADGFAGLVRLELREAESIAWYWTYLVGVPGFEGVIVVRDHEVTLPRQGLEIRAEGLWAELWCESAREHWTFGLEAFGVRLDAPEDALRPGGEIGERVAVGLDLEWEVGDASATDGLVHGDVLVGRERFTIEAPGSFYENVEAPTVEGAVVARVIVPGVGERRLVDTGEMLRWT